ncbi:hypothetical protein SAMN05216268_12688 [Streptomyces yunnanensis]|uniref:Uncharacterized protein n=1 Tax=Streptomyces yunnanensis TaxID=156453 RepID=A0A9X8N7T4_9ACTN|nr:hypothetical protein SAMN05216268_12688 [Streptomyces yunnanensis]
MNDEAQGPARTGKSQRVDRIAAGVLDPTWSLMSQSHRRFPVKVSYFGSLRGPLQRPAR